MSIESLFNLSGRVALVSGAGQNMGRSTAIALAEAGADLMICGRHIEPLEDTAAEIEKLGRRAVPVICDVAKPEMVTTLFGRLDKEYGRIDVLANIPGSNMASPPEDISLETFMGVLQATLVSKFCCSQEAGRRMLKAGKGSIINMSSIGGVLALGRGNLAYSVGQAGVIQMTRELSTEWSGRGVRVNAIAPAQIINARLATRMERDPGLRAVFLNGIPMDRLGVPDDIKGLAIFLASDASGFITGHTFPLDGGNLAMNAGGSSGR